MLCPHCNTEVPDEGLFCPECGAKLTVSQMQGERTVSPEEAPMQQVTVNRAKRRVAIMGSVAAALILILVLSVTVGGKERKMYRQAQTLYGDGSYARAQELFIQLDNYKDAPQMAEECRLAQQYAKAILLLNTDSQSDCTAAAELFASLGDYNDALQQAQQANAKSDYLTAKAMMNNEDYEGAAQLLEALGDYSDAQELKIQCDRHIDYNSAVVCLQQGDYKQAQNLLGPLGEFLDAKALLKQCENAKQYEGAKVLFDDGQYETAKERFSSLGDFEDSARYLQWCEVAGDYDTARELVQQGQYTQAQPLLEEAAALQYKDAVALLGQCKANGQNKTTYAKATEYFNAKSYYKAYQLFLSLGDYSDAASKAKECKRTPPSTGVLYQNSAYDGGSVSLKIYAPSGSSFLYIKIKSGTSTVRSMFFSSGASASVSLPSGAYTIDYAYGSTWYGEKDAFGENGEYGTLLNGSTTSFSFSDGYSYELKMQVSSGGNVGSKSKGWGSF